MPPKRKKGGKKASKSGRGKKNSTDAMAGFRELLDEVLYVAPEEKYRREKQAIAAVRSLIHTFEFEAGSRLCDAREIPTMICALGFNPTSRQLAFLTERILLRSAAISRPPPAQLPLVNLTLGNTSLGGGPANGADAPPTRLSNALDLPERFDGDAFLSVLLPVILTHEIVYEAALSGTVGSSSSGSKSAASAPPEVEIVPRHTEEELLRAFECIWKHQGPGGGNRKLDFDDQRCIEWESMREALTATRRQLPSAAGPSALYRERLDDMELEEMYNAAVDPESGYVREDYITALAFE